jgi:hypothetical protein
LWKPIHPGDNKGHNLTLYVYQFPTTIDPDSHIIPMDGVNERSLLLAWLLRYY